MKHVLPCIYNLSFSLTVSCSSLIFQRTTGSRYLKNQYQRTVSSGYLKTNQNQRTCWFWVFQNPHKVLVHPTPKASYTTGVPMDGALVATGSVWLSQLVCEIVDRLWVYPHPVNLLLSPSGSQ